MSSAMSDRHSTTSIQRPRDPTRAAARAARESTMSEHTLFGELTRAIPEEKQLVTGRSQRAIIAVAATVIAAALVAALFVLPVKAWLRQGDDLSQKRSELDILEQANARLNGEVNRLNTEEGIKEAAREEVGYVDPGEKRVTVLPTPNAPMTLPAGWPYDAVSQIIAVRSQGTVDPPAATTP